MTVRWKQIGRASIGLMAAAFLASGVGLLTAQTGSAALGAQASPRVLVTKVATEITPVVADQIGDGVSRAEGGAYAAYVIELDTPGGLDSSMRAIVQDILASEVPVIVFVAPQGARAASAGAIITIASHVAIMAPGTSIGSATPVGLQGEDLEAKVVNDAAAYSESLARLRGRDTGFAVAMVRDGQSATAEAAVERNVVDATATSLDDALLAADGKAVIVAGGREVNVSTAGAAVERYDFGPFRRILQFLANPNLAFLLLTLGTLGLIYELATPGVGIAGSVGVVSIVLALFSLAVLPVNAVGLILLAVAAALFVGELFAPGIAGFAFGGAVALVLGAVFLFDDAEGARVNLAVALPSAIVMGVLSVLAGRLVLRSHRQPTVSSGTGLLLGQTVPVQEIDDAGQSGRAFIDGAWWKVRTIGPRLVQDAQATVTAMEGLTLIVTPAGPVDSTPTPDQADTER